MAERGISRAELLGPALGWAEDAAPVFVRRSSGWRHRLLATLESEIERGRGGLWLPVAFGIGILVVAALPAGTPAWPVLLLTAAAVAAAVLVRGTAWPFRLLLLLSFAFAGGGAMTLRTIAVAAPMLTEDWTGRLEGWVEAVEPISSGSRRLTVRVTAMEGVAVDRQPRRVRITVRGQMPRPLPGDGVVGLVSLAANRGPVIPGGYDFGRAAFYEGIGASGFSYGVPAAADLGTPPLSIRLARPLAQLRTAIGERIEAAMPGVTGEIANALVTGERGGMTEATEEALRDSGLYHIISISGLHMALVAGVAFAGLRGLLALFPSVALRHPIKKWAAAGALAVTTAYLLLSGGEVATQRSWVMLAILLAAVLLDRRAFSVRNVAVAALVVLALQPESLLSASFQMSFAATLALVAGFEAMADRRRLRAEPRSPAGPLRFASRWFGIALVTAVLAGLATAPFSAYHFQRTAPLSLLANLAADPVIAILVMPPALLAVLLMPFGLEPGPLAVMDHGLRTVLAIAETVASWSGDAGLLPMFGVGALGLMVAGLLWLCLWRERWRLLGLAAIAAGIALAATASRPDILVAPDGEAAAVRAEDGRYRILAAGRASFEAEIWLRADADPRQPGDRSLKEGVLCDPLGCTTLAIGGRRVALSLRPEAFAEDCVAAVIVISALAAPVGCAEGGVLLDGEVLHARGAAAIAFPRDGESGLVRIDHALSERRRAGEPPLRGTAPQ